MEDYEIENWISFVNYPPAAEVLRDYIKLREDRKQNFKAIKEAFSEERLRGFALGKQNGYDWVMNNEYISKEKLKTMTIQEFCNEFTNLSFI